MWNQPLLAHSQWTKVTCKELHWSQVISTPSDTSSQWQPRLVLTMLCNRPVTRSVWRGSSGKYKLILISVLTGPKMQEKYGHDILTQMKTLHMQEKKEMKWGLGLFYDLNHTNLPLTLSWSAIPRKPWCRLSLLDCIIERDMEHAYHYNFIIHIKPVKISISSMIQWDLLNVLALMLKWNNTQFVLRVIYLTE